MSFVGCAGSQKLNANTVVHHILSGQDRPQAAQTPAEEALAQLAQSIGSVTSL